MRSCSTWLKILYTGHYPFIYREDEPTKYGFYNNAHPFLHKTFTNRIGTILYFSSFLTSQVPAFVPQLLLPFGLWSRPLSLATVSTAYIQTKCFCMSFSIEA
jgi:hypothetical protein